MTLCLVGNHSLDSLEELAVEHFHEVENKELQLRDYVAAGQPLFDQESMGHLVKIVPIKDLRQLTVTWPGLPGSRHLWDGDPLAYISHVMGHEGPNSLLSELIKQDLASSLSSGSSTRCQSNFSGFSVTLNLTEKGVLMKEDVIRLIFAKLNAMRAGEGPPEYISQEKKVMSEINFQFVQRSPAMAYSKTRASALNNWNENAPNKVSIDEILFQPYSRASVWRPDEVKRYLDMLTPQACYIVHQSKGYESEDGLQVEPIYDTKFKKEPIPSELLEAWATAQPK